MKKAEKSAGNGIEPAHTRSFINHSRNFYVHTSERMWQKMKRIVEADDDVPDMSSFTRLAVRNEIRRRGHVFIDDRPVVWKTPPVFRDEVIRTILRAGKMLNTMELAEILEIKRNTIASKLRRLLIDGVLTKELRKIKIYRLNRYHKSNWRYQAVNFWGVHENYMPKRTTKVHWGTREIPTVQHE
jgi:hypothetical protein